MRDVDAHALGTIHTDGGCRFILHRFILHRFTPTEGAGLFNWCASPMKKGFFQREELAPFMYNFVPGAQILAR